MKTMDSLDLYLEYPANEVIIVDELVDSTGGIYPVYYREDKDRLRIATSVSALIKDLGDFEYNSQFKPDGSKQFLATFLSVDSRIRRLRPFEVVSKGTSRATLHPTWELKDVETFLQRSVQYFSDFIQDIEMRYPTKKHVVLTGGRDSRLTLLVAKRNPAAWYIFSSQPDLYYVKQWLEVNHIRIEGVFEHDGFCDEDLEFVKEKVIRSDAYVDVRHARWVLAQKKIAERFHGQCIFWTGDTGLIYQPNPFARDEHKRDYFDQLLIRASFFHGSKNQLIKNLTGCPRLTMYYSPKIWEELYSRFDFSVIDKDYRELLGDYIAGREIWWEPCYPQAEWWDYSPSHTCVHKVGHVIYGERMTDDQRRWVEEIYLGYIRGLI